MYSQRVRTAALRYLAVMPSLVKYDVLHPQKATVLRELAKALDDPKRAVRKEAVEARWVCFLISSRILLDHRISQNKLVQVHGLSMLLKEENAVQ